MRDDPFWRDASDRLTFDLSRVPIESYPTVCAAVIEAFHLAPVNALVTNGCDILFQDYRRSGQVVGLEWDNWMGFTVTAKTPDSESLVREIGSWLLRSAWAKGS